MADEGARVPKTVGEYVAIFRRGVESQFIQDYVRPCLVGLGIVGELERGPQRPGTLSVYIKNMQDTAETAALCGRVWVIRRAPGGKRGAGIAAGRSGDNDIVIPDYSVSFRHCTFIVQMGRILIQDLNSTNGTYLDGERIPVGSPRAMKDGTRVTLGRFTFEFLAERGFLERIREKAGR